MASELQLWARRDSLSITKPESNRFSAFAYCGGIGFLCQNPTAFYPVGTWHFKTLVKLWRGLKRPCRQTSCFNSNLPIRLYVNLCILGMLFTCKSLDCVDIQESLRLLLNFTILKFFHCEFHLPYRKKKKPIILLRGKESERETGLPAGFTLSVVSLLLLLKKKNCPVMCLCTPVCSVPFLSCFQQRRNTALII
ncbi:hypothetical protein AB205_0038800 [Aquarana catesbeiana]|uniref:Uncharacterized protein n=1 Tax=Aquarana catesbeiana TaxID=8400 RepID=A0A2G9RTY5_AQUCT|nr:hypothetical protein AB205_0038800 [Aquarana catesbeiana]